MKLIDLRHPFFLPLWRRVATVTFTTVWALFELLTQSVGWGIFIGGLSAYCAWEFFIAFDPAHFEDQKDD